MQFSAIVNRFIMKALLNSAFTNDLKRKENFSKIVHSCRLSLFKEHFEFEQYLNIIKNFDKRRSLTKFRISAHRLKIERGRFSKPPFPVESRFCDHCLSEIEDEFHFLIKCSKYNSPHNNLFSVVQINCRNFCSLKDKVKYLSTLVRYNDIHFWIIFP